MENKSMEDPKKELLKQENRFAIKLTILIILFALAMYFLLPYAVKII